MYVMECPICGEICASASEYDLLPQFTTCDNCNKKDVSEKTKQD